MTIFRNTLTIVAAAFAIGLASCGGTAQAGGSDVFTTQSGKRVEFTFIKHGSLEIKYDSLYIQVDPVSQLPPVTDYSRFHKADIILITHEHYDHYDEAAIDTLCDSTTRIVLNGRCAAMLRRGTALANGNSLQLRSDITIDAVPAYNTTPAHTKFHPKGRDNGYVLTLDGFRIYIAGDTEDIPELKNLQNIDVAFLPCNQPYTMTLDQFVDAVKAFSPRVVYPYHYNDTQVSRLPDMLKGYDVRIRPMK